MEDGLERTSVLPSRETSEEMTTMVKAFGLKGQRWTEVEGFIAGAGGRGLGGERLVE